MAAGMPGWQALMEKLIDSGMIEYGAQSSVEEGLNYAREAVKAGNLPMAASHVHMVLSSYKINGYLNEIFSTSPYSISPEQRKLMDARLGKLMRAAWAGIVTTNYDSLIEEGFLKNAGESIWQPDIKIIDGESSRFCEVLLRAREFQTFYVKLHGSTSASKVVLTTEEYDEAYLRNPQISTFLTALMLQYHLVFIGCSLEDEIVRIRRRLTADFKGSIPPAYAIMPRNPRNEAKGKFLAVAALIEPIWYDSPPNDTEHAGLDELLDQFASIQIPEDIRTLLRFRKLSERLIRVSPRNKRLLAYIASQTGRSINLEDLVDGLQDDPKLRGEICSSAIEDELKYRMLFLMAIGLLLQTETRAGQPIFTLPPGLKDEDLRK